MKDERECQANTTLQTIHQDSRHMIELQVTVKVMKDSPNRQADQECQEKTKSEIKAEFDSKTLTPAENVSLCRQNQVLQ